MAQNTFLTSQQQKIQSVYFSTNEIRKKEKQTKGQNKGKIK